MEVARLIRFICTPSKFGTVLLQVLRLFLHTKVHTLTATLRANKTTYFDQRTVRKLTLTPFIFIYLIYYYYYYVFFLLSILIPYDGYRCLCTDHSITLCWGGRVVR